MPRTRRRAPGPRSLHVSEAFASFVLDQLADLGDVTSKRMFCGVGLYRGELFFAVLARDVLYFKTDAANRPDYERAGMPPFAPFGGAPSPRASYYAVPLAVVESAADLTTWARKAVAAAANSGVSGSGARSRSRSAGPTRARRPGRRATR